MRDTDIRIVDVELFFIPVQTRMPLKFGAESLDSVTCARAKITVEKRDGSRSVGWGETPLSVQWVWPSSLSYEFRLNRLKAFAESLAVEIAKSKLMGHAVEIGVDFIEQLLGDHAQSDAADNETPLPYLASLVVGSIFDQAIHDAYGVANKIDIYQAYGREFLDREIAEFFRGHLMTSDVRGKFAGRYLDDFLELNPPQTLPVWHLVGGLDPVSAVEVTDQHPDDGYPVSLEDWIEADKLKCLKVKLRGTDEDWDLARMIAVGNLSLEMGVTALSADFNCMVTDVEYVNQILDKLKADHQAIWDLILYVEQPFPYELDDLMLNVESLSTRKPLFLDESAHDWRHVELGRSLGWSGVALKTCKTQTGALLSLCWAKVHEMPLMVQDLTNPMLAMIPHVRLAAHAGTIMGVESNAMQFYPAASDEQAKIHPRLYRRRDGVLDLSTISGDGFGYRIDEMELPKT
ncbi:hypothetical protein OAG71_02340 [bacterium]|nr:hypothetical protein [bacterium]